MEPDQILLIRGTFGLSQSALARSMNVAKFTVLRWEKGENAPTGLHDDVLRALHQVALRLLRTKGSAFSEVTAREVGDLVRSGIGTLILNCLATKREGS